MLNMWTVSPLHVHHDLTQTRRTHSCSLTEFITVYQMCWERLLLKSSGHYLLCFAVFLWLEVEHPRVFNPNKLKSSDKRVTYCALLELFCMCWQLTARLSPPQTSAWYPSCSSWDADEQKKGQIALFYIKYSRGSPCIKLWMFLQ